MRKRMAWALAAGLAVGIIGTSAQADDDPPPPPPKAPPTGGWVGPFKDWNKPAPKPEPKKTDAPPPPHKLTLAEQVQSARYREQADLLRRMAVCDKLREIAVRTGDTELSRRVDQLEERANNVYSEHAVKLAQAVEGTKAASSIAMADSNKLLDKKDAAPVVAARGNTP